MARALEDDARAWLADSGHLVHVSVLVFLPLIVYGVTRFSALSDISYLIFPPLASAVFTLFFDPDGTYSTVRRLVGGLTLGAAVGWAMYAAFGFSSLAAALAVLGTSLLTWPLDLEHPSAYATALLAVLLQADSPLYVAGVFLSTGAVGALFHAWRATIYEPRGRYLYDALRDEDRVLIPIRGDPDIDIVEVGGRIAAAHDDGRIVLLGMDGVQRSEIGPLADEVRDRFGIPVDTAVTPDDDPDRVLETADRYGCSVIAARYQEDGDPYTPFTRRLFEGDQDVILFRLDGDTGPWDDAIIPVKDADRLSRVMIELGSRLVDSGDISVTSVIDRERDRRRAEKRLFDIVSGFEDVATDRSDLLDTRIIDAGDRPIHDVITEAATDYGLAIVGASTDRSSLSRMLRGPTAAPLLDGRDGPLLVVHSSTRRPLADLPVIGPLLSR